jgi:DNA-binding winged helix-turn-helix (wHTH) protein
VRKLRQKLEKVSPRWRYIHTHFGIGYRFAAEPIDAVAEAAGEVVAGGQPSVADTSVSAESPREPDVAPAPVAG